MLENENEYYNGGRPFKCTCRTSSGVILTIIADNYFGYCKKEIKTLISYSANIMGMSEEEHAGGTLAFPRYYGGMEFDAVSEATQWPSIAGYNFGECFK